MKERKVKNTDELGGDVDRVGVEIKKKCRNNWGMTERKWGTYEDQEIKKEKK